MIFYQVPIELVSPETLRTMHGAYGTFLNPILDINDNWIVSVEEWKGEEFQYLKDNYAEIANAFVQVDTEPKKFEIPEGI